MSLFPVVVFQFFSCSGVVARGQWTHIIELAVIEYPRFAVGMSIPTVEPSYCDKTVSGFNSIVPFPFA